jgi:predicted RNA-binding protein with TRAM domain
VRQLRLRDIGGIIVIDFIDMANPKNRATVEEALRSELERDRTKTYVVEISPLGLVEMTRQNVTDGPREVMTKKCPTCGGDGIVLSETSAAVDIERRLRALAAGSRHQAYQVEVAAKVAAILIGPGASRLVELEEQTRRRFYLKPKADEHLDHFVVLAEGKREDLAPAAPVTEGARIELTLVEVGLHDPNAGVGKLDGLDVCVADAAKLVGKKVKAQVERVLDGTAYATLVTRTAKEEPPITAESEAEKPTRKPAAKKEDLAPEDEAAVADEPAVVEENVLADEPAFEESTAEDSTAEERERAAAEGEPQPKKKTRRGTRGGRGRKKKTAAATAAAPGNGAGDPEDVAPPLAAEIHVPEDVAPPIAAKIHVPDPELGDDEAEPVEESSGDGAKTTKPKKKTRRGTRGGRGRKKKTATTTTTAATATTDGDEPPATTTDGTEPPATTDGDVPPAERGEAESADWQYVPMSEWGDEVDR